MLLVQIGLEVSDITIQVVKVIDIIIFLPMVNKIMHINIPFGYLGKIVLRPCLWGLLGIIV